MINMTPPHRVPGTDGVHRACRVTIRLTPEEKQEWARQAAGEGKSLTDYVISRVCQPCQPRVSHVSHAAGTQGPELRDEVAWLFQFFQRNASKLVLTDGDRAKLKTIMEKVRST